MKKKENVKGESVIKFFSLIYKITQMNQNSNPFFLSCEANRFSRYRHLIIKI